MDIKTGTTHVHAPKNQIMNVVASRRQYFLLHFLNCGINDDTTSFSGNSSILSTVLLFIWICSLTMENNWGHVAPLIIVLVIIINFYLITSNCNKHYRNGEILLTADLYTTGLSPYRSEKCAVGDESALSFDEWSWDTECVCVQSALVRIYGSLL